MDDPFEDVAVDIIESEKLFDSGFLMVGSPHTLGMAFSCEADTGDGAQFHGPELIIADNVRS